MLRLRTMTITIVALLAMTGSTNAAAAVTAFFSAGSNCKGPPVSKFRAGGPEFKVTLCMSATEEAICGHSLQLEATTAAASGHFEVVKHAMGPNYPDPTLEKMPAPITITLPPSPHDFGGTRDNPAMPAAGQLLATFTLRALPSAKKANFEVRLGKNSLVSVGKDGGCLQNSEIPISASLKLTRE